jgi:chemotaxis signal transduction protein
MTELSHLESTVAQLREEFDGGFALPIDRGSTRHQEYVLIHIASTRYAIALSDVAGLFVGRAITRVPSDQPEYLGLVDVRGSLFSVFDLASILGHPATTKPHWLMACSARPDVAFAFDALGGHSRVDPTDVVSRSAGAQAVRANGFLYDVIRLGPLVDSLRARILSSSPTPGGAR